MISPKELLEKESEIRTMIFRQFPSTELAEPIYDGVADVRAYLIAPKRVLWMLKEPFDDGENGGGGWNLVKDVLVAKNDTLACHPTFRPMMYITYGVFKSIPDWWDDRIPYSHDSEEVRSTLKQIALINVNKMPARSRSFSRSVKEAYQRNRKLLLHQIESYRPEILFYASDPETCFITDDLGFSSNDFIRHGDAHYLTTSTGMRVVWVYHPAYQKGEDKMGKYISEAVFAALAN